jgi:hypothetical protein
MTLVLSVALGGPTTKPSGPARILTRPERFPTLPRSISHVLAFTIGTEKGRPTTGRCDQVMSESNAKKVNLDFVTRCTPTFTLCSDLRKRAPACTREAAKRWRPRRVLHRVDRATPSCPSAISSVDHRIVLNSFR